MYVYIYMYTLLPMAALPSKFFQQWFLAFMGPTNLYRTAAILLREWCEVGRYGSEAVAEAIGLLKAAAGLGKVAICCLLGWTFREPLAVRHSSTSFFPLYAGLGIRAEPGSDGPPLEQECSWRCCARVSRQSISSSSVGVTYPMGFAGKSTSGNL